MPVMDIWHMRVLMVKGLVNMGMRMVHREISIMAMAVV